MSKRKVTFEDVNEEFDLDDVPSNKKVFLLILNFTCCYLSCCKCNEILPFLYYVLFIFFLRVVSPLVDRAPGLKANIPLIAMKRMKGMKQTTSNIIFWTVMMWRVCPAL